MSRQPMKSVILLVEDNREMVEVIAEELSEHYEVLSAYNGKQALSILDSEVVHLVISDVMMPVMNGFELCKVIKSDSHYGHIPVVLLTARDSLEAKIEGLGLGSDAYIPKPFDMEYLLAQVASLLDNRKKVKEFFAHSPQAFLHVAISSRMEESFLEALTQLILDNIEDLDLDVTKLAKMMAISRTSLFRKIKTITNLTPNELINMTRLRRAAELFAESNYKIYEVSDMVGFGSQAHFGRTFHKQFGMTPTEYQRRLSRKVLE